MEPLTVSPALLDSLQGDLSGLPQDDPDRRCPCGGDKCDGYGHVYTGEGMKICKAMREQEIIRMLPEFEDWPVLPFTEIRTKSSFLATRSFTEAELLARAAIDPVRDPYALIELGGHGRSKTYSALQVCRICAYKNVPFVAVRFPAIINQYKRGVDGCGWIDRLYAQIKKSRFVFIDEYGREAIRGNLDHSRIALNEVVNRCYRQRFLTITSNMTREEFKKNVSSDLVSRLFTRNGYSRIIEEPSGKEHDLRDQPRLI